MVDSFRPELDLSGWATGLDKLGGELKTSLARSMAVAGGKVLRDEAKHQAPVEDGVLRDAIYLAYSERRTGNERVVYSVTWNSQKAPHGHLLEFGHWQPFKVVYNKKSGQFTTLAKGKGGGPNAVPNPGGPKWIAARSFLRPALSVAGQMAANAMILRGRERFPELLAGGSEDGD